jgi:tetratricopeptide (TPR) repeat protein
MSTSSWTDYKNEGRDAYAAERYEAALEKYRAALYTTNPAPPPSYDRQILLSNIVACRLKLHHGRTADVSVEGGGGSTQHEHEHHLEFALDEARQCVRLNPEWAKGHVRLGSVYQAMNSTSTRSNVNTRGVGSSHSHNHHSNDACQSFQRALQLDPTNPTARAMLTQELRRGTPSHAPVPVPPSAASSNNNNSNPTPSPSAPPYPTNTNNNNNTTTGQATGTSSSNDNDHHHDPRPRPDDIPTSSSSSTQQPRPSSSRTNNRVDDVDDTSSWSQRLHYQMLRTKMWYGQLSEDKKALMKIVLALLVLYVAFGGRFGLGSNHHPTDSFHYSSSSSSSQHPYNDNNNHRSSGSGSANTARRTTTTSSSGGGSSNHRPHEHSHNNNNNHQRSSQQHYNNNNDDYYDPYDSSHRRSSRGSSSSSSSWSFSNFELSNLFDGSLPSMLILGGIAYGCHKFGVSVSISHDIYIYIMEKGEVLYRVI